MQWRFVCGWAVVSLGLVVWALLRMHIDRAPTAEAGQANLMALKPWWTASASLWAALSAMGWMLARGQVRHAREAFGRTALLILLVAVAARSIVLIGHRPTLSDDVYRYVLDGRNLAHGFNPYLDTPAERAGFQTDGLLERPLSVLMSERDADTIDERWPGEAALLPLVNNPELHTIYLPTSQWVFAGAGWLIRDAWSDPESSARVFRIVIVGFEILAMLGLFIVLAGARKSPWWAVLYAWHPLPLAELAGSGHQDSIGLALMMLAFVFFMFTPRRVWLWTITLALAALVKPVVLPLAAFMLKDVCVRRNNAGALVTPSMSRAPGTITGPRTIISPTRILSSILNRWTTWVSSALIGAAVCVAVSAPLWLTHDREPLENLQATSSRFSMKWAHFGPVYESTLWTIRVFDPIDNPEIEWQKKDRQEARARVVCLVLVALVCMIALLSPADAWRSSRAILFAMVLFSTTAHPWYLLWALILTPAVFSPAVWIASLTLLLGYMQLGDVVDWKTPGWVMWAAYVPVCVALFVDMGWKLVCRRLEL